MYKATIFPLILPIFLTSLLGLMSASSARAVSPRTADLDWLVGCWDSDDGSAREVWAPASDGSLIGFGVVVVENRIVFYELLRVAVTDGVLTYEASPFGGPSTSFSMGASTQEQVTFVAPEHDYPQQIDYRLTDGVLHATISELGGLVPRSFDKRRCE